VHLGLVSFGHTVNSLGPHNALLFAIVDMVMHVETYLHLLLYSFKDLLYVCTLILLVLNLLAIYNLQIPPYQNILELPTHKKDTMQFLIMFIIYVLILTFPFMISIYCIL
jgi:hypothetical protein